MAKLPSVTGKQLIAALSSLGFQVVRKRGSHRFLQHPDGRATVVPIHSGETLGPGLLAKILRDCEISRDDLAGVI
jgi:predicted RNA binding protein YcfA (HicA-like mRNA interferase family)